MPMLSETYRAGANNQVAALALAGISVFVTWILWRKPSVVFTPPRAQVSLGWRYLWWAIAVAMLWTAVLGFAVLQAHVYWGDAGYFLHQLQAGLDFQRVLYRDFEFPYGPLLYWWPAAFVQGLAPLGVSRGVAYLESLAAMQALGLGLAFYVVRALPLRRSLQAAAFLLLSCGTLTSLLGLNYSLMRFALPLAGVVLLSRQSRLRGAVAVAMFGEATMLAVSPELGLAFAAAATVYGASVAMQRGWRWATIGVIAIISGLFLFTIIGGDFFLTIGRMAHGEYNLLLTPAPHIVALLAAAVVLAPLALARGLRGPHAGLLAAVYVVGLGILPGAMGRCDPIHVFFNGLPLLLLSFVAVEPASAVRRRVWLALVVLVLALTQVANAGLYRDRLRMIAGGEAGGIPAAAYEGVDVARLREALAGGQVSAPALAPEPVTAELAGKGQYVPGFYCGWVGVWDDAAEQRKIAEMRETKFALVVTTDPAHSNPVEEQRLQRWMKFGFAAHPLREPWVAGALLNAELQAGWRQTGVFGDYALYERRK